MICVTVYRCVAVGQCALNKIVTMTANSGLTIVQVQESRFHIAALIAENLAARSAVVTSLEHRERCATYHARRCLAVRQPFRWVCSRYSCRSAHKRRSIGARRSHVWRIDDLIFARRFCGHRCIGCMRAIRLGDMITFGHDRCVT